MFILGSVCERDAALLQAAEALECPIRCMAATIRKSPSKKMAKSLPAMAFVLSDRRFMIANAEASRIVKSASLPLEKFPTRSFRPNARADPSVAK
jgi:hypothetical protein